MEDLHQTNEIVTLMMIVGVFIMVAFAFTLVLFFYRSQQRLLSERMEQQALKIKHQENLLYSTIITQEQERKRIAKDLHDEIGSKLNVIFLNLHRLRKQGKTQPALLNTIGDITTLINTTIDTTRRISHNLLPPILEEFGLIEALKELKEAYTKTDIIEIELAIVGNTTRLLDKNVELNLFRVVQELISNSIKHGKSTLINMEITLNSENFHLQYMDNGQGFDTKDLANKKGLGLKNMESRLNMIQAKIDYQSEIGKGVIVNIYLKNQ